MVRLILSSGLNARQVSVQEALWIRTGKRSCKSSRTLVALPCLQFSTGEAPQQDRSCKAFVSTNGSVRQTNALILSYVQRPDSLDHLSFIQDTTKYHLSKTVHASLQLREPVRECEYASRRPVDAVVFISARIEAADIDSSSKAMLYLHVPWRSLDAIAPLGDDPAAVLKSAVDRDERLSVPLMIQHYERLSTQGLQMKNQQCADQERVEHEQNTFNVHESSGSGVALKTSLKASNGTHMETT